MSLIEVNTKEAEKKLSLVRRYYMELSIVILSMVVVYLFYAQKDLEKDVRGYLMNDRMQMLEKITNNTDAIQRNTSVLLEIKDVIRDNRVILDQIKDSKK